MDFERTIEHCTELISDLAFTSVREWKQKESGRKAIAYFPVYAPAEIIHAAGMLPVGLAGAGDRLDLQHADARFGSFICSIIKTTQEMAMVGHLAPFDGMLFSTICDSARNLCFVMKRNNPEMYLDFLHLPHNPSSEAAGVFLAAEYRRLLAQLELMGGRKVSDDDLRHSISLFNHNREMIRQLYAMRAESPHLLLASESYVLVRAGNFIPVEEHNKILEDALTEIPKRSAKRRDSIRIVVEGSFCEQPPLELIKLIEAGGCYIVDDDFTLGRNWFHEDVPLTDDPTLSLAQSYLDRSVYSSVRHDFRKPRWEGLIEKVRTSRADAVLFLIAKFCEPAYFDFVPFKDELDKAGIAYLLIEFEEKLFTFDRIRMEIETFVESLVFD